MTKASASASMRRPLKKGDFRRKIRGDDRFDEAPQSNRTELAQNPAVHSMTDVTGFGFRPGP